MSCKRGPRNILLSLIYKKSRKVGGQQQHITTSLSTTLTYSLNFDKEVRMNDWMLEARLDPKKWQSRVETALKLAPNTYIPFKIRNW